MQKIGYSLVELSSGDEIQVVTSLPRRFTIPGVGVASFDQAGQVVPDSENPTHKVVERWSDPAPSVSHTLASESPSYDGTKVIVTRTWDAPPAPTVGELQEYAAAKRRELANGSATIDVGSRTIPTWVDPESRGSITGLALGLSFESELTAPWKGADGEFYTLTSAEIPVMALGMMAFIQTCFAAEAAVLAAIDAETITTYAEIDAAAWPSTGA